MKILPCAIDCHVTKSSTPMAVIVIVGTPAASKSLATGGMIIMPSAYGRRIVLGREDQRGLRRVRILGNQYLFRPARFYVVAFVREG